MNKKILTFLICSVAYFMVGCERPKETPPAPAKVAEAPAVETAKPVPAPAPVAPEAKPTVAAPAPTPVPEKKVTPAKPKLPASKPAEKPAPVAKKPAAPKKPAETRAVIATSHGNIELRFFPDVAPNHVKNFLELARRGFYDGTTFHRVIPNFMIQGGDPNSRDLDDRSRHGSGGPGYTVNAEFSDRPHKRGTLSMARAMDPNSAGSQFFICVADAPSLDGKYTVFGEVVSGLETVERIVSAPRDARDNPLDRIVMKVTVRDAKN